MNYKYKEKDKEYLPKEKKQVHFPEFLDDLSSEEKWNTIDSYRIIVSHALWDHEFYTCNQPAILDIIMQYHKEGIPYWCIVYAVKENIDTYKQPVRIEKLLEFFGDISRVKDICRKIFAEQKEFKKKIKNPFAIGIKI